MVASLRPTSSSLTLSMPRLSLQFTSLSRILLFTPSFQLKMHHLGSLQEPNTLLSLDSGGPDSFSTGLCCAWQPCSGVPYKPRGLCLIRVQYSSLPFFKPLGYTFSVHSHNMSHNLSAKIGCSAMSLFYDKLYARP